MSWKYERSKKTYTPGFPYAISRSKIDLFVDCPLCFYLDVRLGVKRPSGPQFTLNLAVDLLLKKEFDLHRARATPHPLMEEFDIDAVPFKHPSMNEWRENFKGIRYSDPQTGLTIFGAIDDAWVTPAGEVLVVDYKATSKDGVVDTLEDTKWHDQYRRQMEIYQWLLRRNDLRVSNTGYFVYANGKRSAETFDGHLEFDTNVIPYVGSDTWIPETLTKLKQCLDSDTAPKPNDECEHCLYRKLARDVQLEVRKK